MKLQIVSDLHTEFGVIDRNYEKMIDTLADVLILAGDVGVFHNIIAYLKKIQEDSGKTVIFVPGNHEYYGTTRQELDVEFRAACTNKLQILTERDIVIGGVAFIGSTGWWDGSGGHIGLTVKGALNDFKMIRDLEKNGDGIWWGQKARSFIDGKLYFYRHNFPDMKKVVITHHFPHARSIHRRFQGSLLNACFCNRWEDIIREYQPELWVHGHTHAGFDYMEGATRLVCNPQGYPEEFAAPRDAIKAHYQGLDLVATEPDYNIYMTTENLQYDPSYIVEV
jgi:Icc-related predicted phosphoesterase